MDTSIIVSCSAVAVSAASAVFAGISSRRAHASLRLQKQIDARRREFRDVKWEADMGADQAAPNGWTFNLRNTGLTPAHDVTLVIQLAPDELFRVGDLKPGESRSFHPVGAGPWHETYRSSMPVTPGHSIHWSSPAGEPDEITNTPIQLFT